MEKRRQKCDIWVLKKVKQKYSYVIFSNINYTLFLLPFENNHDDLMNHYRGLA